MNLQCVLIVEAFDHSSDTCLVESTQYMHTITVTKCIWFCKLTNGIEAA